MWRNEILKLRIGTSWNFDSFFSIRSSRFFRIQIKQRQSGEECRAGGNEKIRPSSKIRSS